MAPQENQPKQRIVVSKWLKHNVPYLKNNPMYIANAPLETTRVPRPFLKFALCILLDFHRFNNRGFCKQCGKHFTNLN